MVALAGCPAAGPKAHAPAAPAWVRPVYAPPPPIEAGELAWRDDGFAEADPTGALAIDGDRLVWTSKDGAIRAAPLDGGPAIVLAQFSEVSDLAVADDRIYVLADGAVWSVSRDGAIVGLARLWSPDRLAVTETAVVVADDDWIRAVPKAGGEPVTLATDAGAPWAIAASDTHVYWTDQGVPPARRGVAVAPCVRITKQDVPVAPHPQGACGTVAQRYGSIRRVPIGGGKVQSRPRFYPRAVTVFDDHVYWADASDEAAIRADLEGNHVERVFGGLGEALAVDAAGTVVLTKRGLLVEVRADGSAPRVHAAFAAGRIALTPEMIYLADAAQGLRRIPRGPSRATVLAVPEGRLDELALDGEQLYYLDRHHDGRDDSLRRVARTGGAVETIPTPPGALEDLAAGGGHVVTLSYPAEVAEEEGAEAEDPGTTFVIDGRPVVLQASPDAIAIDGDRLYWLEYAGVYARPIAGGAIETIRPMPDEITGYGYSGGPPPMSFSVHGGVVVAAKDDLAGAIRIDTRPAKGKAKRKAAPRTEVVAGALLAAPAGDRWVVWTDRGLELGGKVVFTSDAFLRDLAADATEAWLILGDDLVRVPLDGTPSEVVLAGVGDAHLELDADAVYLAAHDLDAVLRIAR